MPSEPDQPTDGPQVSTVMLCSILAYRSSFNDQYEAHSALKTGNLHASGTRSPTLLMASLRILDYDWPWHQNALHSLDKL